MNFLVSFCECVALGVAQFPWPANDGAFLESLKPQLSHTFPRGPVYAEDVVRSCLGE